MRVWVCTDHDTHYPVGGASVVLAEHEDEARRLLDAELAEHGLAVDPYHPYTLRELTEKGAVVLNSGDY